MEYWKHIADGFYEVSSMGNVRRAKPGIGTFVGRPLKTINSPLGYSMVVFSCNGTSQRHLIHRLVAIAFLGEIDGMIINHKDFNKQNNNVENLEIVTQKENMAHFHLHKKREKGPTKPKEPLKGKQIGDKHWMRRNPEKILHGEELKSKLTTDQVINIKKDRELGMLYKDIVKKYSISIAHVSRIILNKRWAHLK